MKTKYIKSPTSKIRQKIKQIAITVHKIQEIS